MPAMDEERDLAKRLHRSRGRRLRLHEHVRFFQMLVRRKRCGHPEGGEALARRRRRLQREPGGGLPSGDGCGSHRRRRFRRELLIVDDEGSDGRRRRGQRSASHHGRSFHDGRDGLASYHRRFRVTCSPKEAHPVFFFPLPFLRRQEPNQRNRTARRVEVDSSLDERVEPMLPDTRCVHPRRRRARGSLVAVRTICSQETRRAAPLDHVRYGEPAMITTRRPSGRCARCEAARARGDDALHPWRLTCFRARRGR